MGWANCGEDSEGRPIGYAHPAKCDYPGCTERIHRGLAYVCGRQMHGDDEHSCEKYFCDQHVAMTRVDDDDTWAPVCDECRGIFLAEISQLDHDERDVSTGAGMTGKTAPGSPEAVSAGCTCPVIDNGHGRGRGGDGASYGHWVEMSCPLHGKDGSEARDGR